MNIPKCFGYTPAPLGATYPVAVEPTKPVDPARNLAAGRTNFPVPGAPSPWAVATATPAAKS